MRFRFPILTILFLFILFSVSAPVYAAKDNWVSVRSKNFYLVGNASEKDIRAVATKLEQFRETFRLIFAKVKFTQSIPTNVVVFKDKNSYNPFRPKLVNGKPNENVAGYFQKGEDVNYITVSTEDGKEDLYGTIFHEYVHFLVDTNIGRSQVPPWFNEGLAEYYQTFQIKEDQKVTLGDLQDGHLMLLQQNQLIPLKTFFDIDNRSLLQNGNHSRSIFYAQAWALIHYLIQGNGGANNEPMNKFLNLVLDGMESEKAFQQAFQMDYAAMEKVLRKYVEQRTYRATLVSFKNKLIFDTEMTSAPLSEAEANAYLGDLLYHTHEHDDAEKYLQKALALDANSGLANTSMGLVKMRQHKFAEAKSHLEKAIAADGKNHMAHYSYAYMLSRESMDEFGYVAKYAPETASKMRAALQKSIAINPEFPESYRLLSFISVVNNENLDEALKYLQKGRALQPGNQDYLYQMAQIYMRQEKFKEAKMLAERLVKTAAEPHLQTNAQNLLDSINQFETSKASFEQAQNEMRSSGEPPVMIRRKSDKSLTEAEIARIKEQNRILALNREIPKPKPDEKQTVGYIQKISCAKGVISYQIKTDTESFTLTSKDFASLDFASFVSAEEMPANMQIGCDAQFPETATVLTYKVDNAPKAIHKGSLVSVALVPKFFKLKTAEELAGMQQIAIVDDTPTEIPAEKQAEFEQQRRDAMMEGLRRALREPQAGEKREMGYVEKIECSGKTMTFFVNINSQVLKLTTNAPQSVKFVSFTPDAQQLQFGCGAKLPPLTTLITFRPHAGAKGKTAGEIIALEFVPKSFKL